MSMLLSGANEAEFELALIEDRFPEVQDGAADSAWLTLAIRVGTPQESWEETAPCLNIYEVQNLAEWLEAVGGAGPDMGEVDLLEPELNFSVARAQGDEVTIRVRFHLEGRPDKLALDAPTDRDYVDIRVGRDQVRSAAAELRRDLEEITARVGSRSVGGEEDSGMMGEPEEGLGLLPPEIAGNLEDRDDDRVF
jgi:hypothetical protein